jgi:phage tail-like protein
MTTFPVNPTRIDPYKNFKFRLTWNGKVVAGTNKASGLPTTARSADAGTPPGRDKYEPITLESGVTHDLSFQNWLNQTLNRDASVNNPEHATQDLVLESFDEAGRKLLTWDLRNYRATEFRSSPEPSTDATICSIHRLVFQTDASIIPKTRNSKK